jgi:hypothetical protein
MRRAPRHRPRRERVGQLAQIERTRCRACTCRPADRRITAESHSLMASVVATLAECALSSAPANYLVPPSMRDRRGPAYWLSAVGYADPDITVTALHTVSAAHAVHAPAATRCPATALPMPSPPPLPLPPTHPFHSTMPPPSLPQPPSAHLGVSAPPSPSSNLPAPHLSAPDAHLSAPTYRPPTPTYQLSSTDAHLPAPDPDRSARR